MRLVVVARRLPPEATAGRCAAFAWLVARLKTRHDVRLVAGYSVSRRNIPDDALGVGLGEAAGPAHLAMWRAARAAVRRHDPAVVLTQGLEVPWLGRPTVAVVRDLVFTGWEPQAAAVGLWHRWRGRSLAAVVAPTQAVRRRLLGRGFGRWRVHVLPEAVPEAEVPSRTADGLTVLVHAGRILPGKGQHLSVDAVSRLPAAAKGRVVLHVAGPPGDSRYLAQLQTAARGQPVRFHPTVEAVSAWLGRADLVLYPSSLPEGFADVAAGALMRGRPVAWADQPGVRETVGGHGLPVPPDDAEGLRAAIAAFLDAPDRWRAVAAAGRGWLRRKHAWARVGPLWNGLLSAASRQRLQ